VVARLGHRLGGPKRAARVAVIAAVPVVEPVLMSLVLPALMPLVLLGSMLLRGRAGRVQVAGLVAAPGAAIGRRGWGDQDETRRRRGEGDQAPTH